MWARIRTFVVTLLLLVGGMSRHRSPALLDGQKLASSRASGRGEIIVICNRSNASANR
jgi:hypothetical protein